MTSYELLAIVEELLAITDPSGYLIATLSKWVADSTKLFELVDATIDQQCAKRDKCESDARNIAKDFVEVQGASCLAYLRGRSNDKAIA